MSSPAVQPEDLLLSITQKPALVVQVDELSLSSPTTESAEVLSRVLEVGKTATIQHQDELELFTVPITRSRTNEKAWNMKSDVPASSVQRSSSHEMLWPQKMDVNLHSRPRRRALRMQLPSFRSLGIASSDTEYSQQRPHVTHRYSGPSTRAPLPAGRSAAQSLPLPRSENTRSDHFNIGAAPLLTPPEDADSIKWNNALLHNPSHADRPETSSTVRSTSQVMASTSEQQPDQATLTTSSQSMGESSGEQQHTSDSSSEHTSGADNDKSQLSRAIQPLSE